MDNKKKGNLGEEVARKFLENKGYNILESQYRTKHGEIDIIAIDEKTIVFIEVKYRKTTKKGSPLEAVNKTKQNKIINSAYQYIIDKNIKNNIRFDVVGILGDEVTHIVNAFGI